MRKANESLLLLVHFHTMNTPWHSPPNIFDVVDIMDIIVDLCEHTAFCEGEIAL